MRPVPTEYKMQVEAYFVNHNTQQTAEHFGIKRRVVREYVKAVRVEKNGVSLSEEKPKPKRERSYSNDELELLLSSLKKYNLPGRKRNVIMPTYTEIYVDNPKYRGTRAYKAVAKKAKKLLDKCKKGKKKSASNENGTEQKKIDEITEPGVIQVDMVDVSKYIDWEWLETPAGLASLRFECVLEKWAPYQREIQYYQYLIEADQVGEKLCRGLMREAECAYRLECDKIMRSTAKELMPKHLYQYTAVDVCTRWAYRIISARKNRETAQLFMSDVMIHAPFRINKVQTDNGTEFTLSDLEKKNPKEKNKKTPFEELLMDNGIEHHLNEKGKPWQNGFVESQHRLDREWFYAHIRITSVG